ncbi:bifunctional diaminohydroxyphosphoribosylaminopyrimidine deaminase/5-amino-6-(5-phosphoribosylamino)uracil reductase RibD [Thiofilum flexile]|uniref:bifunctional diaminohydroxyphosphoribosylaminopyrimidine deaminase/5-amino-6-(5-phosphoribosylamino)uracil reductase RibD n=1 Tax=Thiofilum flexile TaxID=125627 RepID=UPI00047725B9|nr:bifunctional diaminohydroxyphosphoribosylaminopyrimidine deaminase/5-amino-6-(5-phosphoribosylamino)uracil reductase RibD [Thiofilum flexile]
MSFSPDDYRYMARALQLAQRGLYTTHPNPRVGCVIVKDGQIVGEGWHERAGEPHAEVFALKQAGALAQGATAYVTLEPCNHYGRTPPCSVALVEAQVGKVMAAMVDPNPQVAGQGLKRLEHAGIKTAFGLMEAEARALNQGFLSQMERGRPFVRAKLASSLDGRTAMASGESVWITGEAARQDVQYWRAQAGAVLTGIGTVLYDNPALNVRLTSEQLGLTTPIRQPLRVIVDSQLRIPLNAQILTLDGAVLIYTLNSDDVAKRAALEQLGVRIRVLETPTIELPMVMQDLIKQGINEVHVEAGATLNGALFAAQLVDELVLYLAPHLMGSMGRPLVELPLQHMSERVGLTIKDMRRVGQDLRLVATPKY